LLLTTLRHVLSAAHISMDNHSDKVKIDSRVHLTGGALLAGMTLLLVGLWYVQVATALVYVKDQEIQSMRTVRIPAVRGSILDKHGSPIAHDTPTFVVNAYLEELRPHFRKEWRNHRTDRKLSPDESKQLEIQIRHKVVKQFIEMLRLDQPIGITPSKMESHFTQQRALPLPVITNLSDTNIARFAENSWKVPGLELEATPKRLYPSPSTAHLTGHLMRNNYRSEEKLPYNYRLPDYAGKLGLEKIFDEYLSGQPGTRAVQVNNLGYRQGQSTPVASQPGSNVVLTLDLTIQDAAMKALEKGLKKCGAKAGSAIVMDVNSGDITAMVSAPVFDPNKFTPGISHALWNQYLTNRPSPLLFRATQERYPPGSIFKIISGLAALENGLDPNKLIESTGSFRIGKRLIKDTASPGQYDFKRAFKKSSNYYFIHQAVVEGHGKEHIIQMGKQFHLGEKTGLLPEQETAGQFPSIERVRNNWSEGDTANLCIGQGEITVTPLQMALMTSAIANGGTIYHPRLVDRIQSPNPNIKENTITFSSAQKRSQLFMRRTDSLKIIREAMYADVAEDEGTGQSAMIPGYNICGKTGTAEVKKPGDPHKITWFASFGPYEKPEYTVIVMVERGVSGGKTCAPIARDIYKAIISSKRKGSMARK